MQPGRAFTFFRRLPLLMLLAVLCLAVGAKFDLIHQYATDLPYWDQWDAEGASLYTEYARGNLDVADFFAPHNEHRIVFTRVLALGLLIANSGQWDGRLQMTVNVFVSVLGLLVLLVALKRRLPSKRFGYVCLFFAVLHTLPLTWENTLSGFQSQFYFLFLFALLHLEGTLLHPADSRRWWLGQLAGICALVAMGSGFLSAAAILATILVRAAAQRTVSKSDVYSLLSSAVILALGLALHTSYAPHEPLRADSLFSFFAAWAKVVAWPLPWSGLGVIIALPWIFLLVHVRRGNLRVTSLVQLALGLGIWWLLQTAAVAYGRANANVVATRYFDTYLAGPFASSIVWAVIWKRGDLASHLRSATQWAILCWTLSIIAGACYLSSKAKDHALAALPHISDSRVRAVQKIVALGSTARGTEEEALALTYPRPARLIELIQQAEIRAILPSSVRAPLSNRDATKASGFELAHETPHAGPAPHAREAWSSFARDRSTPAHFDSGLIPAPCARFLRIYVTGQIDGNAGVLALRTASGLKQLEVKAKPNRWTSVLVDSPRTDFSIVATSAPQAALAFTEPLEEATGSWAARQLVKSSDLLTGAGTVLLALGLFVRLGGAFPKSRNGIPEIRTRILLVLALVLSLGFLFWFYEAWGAGGVALRAPPLVLSAATLLIVGLSAWPLMLVACPILATKGRLSDNAALLASTGLIALAGYITFWAYFVHPRAGAIFVGLLCLTAWAALSLHWPRIAEWWRRSDARLPLAAMLVLAAGYIAILHLYGATGDVETLAANRFVWTLPSDQEIPRLFAERLLSGTSPKQLVGDWLSSDRPPLQAGLVLATLTWSGPLGLPNTDAAYTTGLVFQLFWIPAAWYLARLLGLSRFTSVGLLLLCATCGFTLINSLYVWPKLGAGALMVGAFCLWRSETKSPLRPVASLMLCALAWLAHGGVAFSMIPAAALGFLGPRKSRMRHLFLGFAAFAALAGSWMAYQKFYEPPGNRLLKWHLAGVISPDERGTVQTLQDEYSRIGINGTLSRKWNNVKETLHGSYSRLFSFDLASAFDRRGEQFFHVFLTLWHWLPAIPLLLWRCLTKRGDSSFDQGFAREVLVWSLLTYFVWVILMFAPRGQFAMLVHQSSYAMHLTWFLLLMAAAMSAGRAVAIAFTLVHAAVFATTWLPPHQSRDVSTPALIVLLCSVAAGTALAVHAARLDRNAPKSVSTGAALSSLERTA